MVKRRFGGASLTRALVVSLALLGVACSKQHKPPLGDDSRGGALTRSPEHPLFGTGLDKWGKPIGLAAPDPSFAARAAEATRELTGSAMPNEDVVAVLRVASRWSAIAAVGATALALFTGLLGWKLVLALWALALIASTLAWLIGVYGALIGLVLVAAGVGAGIQAILKNRRLREDGKELVAEGNYRDGIALMAAGDRRINAKRRELAEFATAGLPSPEEVLAKAHE